MKKRITVFIVAVITAFCLVAQPAMVHAESLDEIISDIREAEKTLESGKEKERSLISQINDLQSKIDELQVKIDEEEIRLEQLTKELEEAQKKVDTQNENLNDRLRNMYKTSSIGYVDVLLDSGSFSEFLTNLELVKIIYSKDQQVLKELKTAREEVEKKKTEVEELHASLEQAQSEVEAQKATVEAKKKEVANDNDETEKLLDELKGEADKLTAELKGQGSSGGSYAGGEMLWPAPYCTYITSKYGYRTHPVTGVQNSFHTGIDIAKNGCHGTAIIAANSGTVSRVVWSNYGYGNYLMIDHGGGVQTLYAHCSNIYVSKGTYVSRGQTIAAVGTTGNSTGPHLHFEVRINGDYTNPYPYIT